MTKEANIVPNACGIRSRRRFLRTGITGLAALPVAGLLGGGAARAGSHLPRLDPGQPPASSLNYAHDATQSKRSGSNAACRNCRHFLGDAGAQWGECNVFQDFLVNADGWCSAYLARG